MRMMAATTLISEALVLFFAGLVAMQLSSLSTGQALGITWSLAVVCFLAAGMLRGRAGYVFGSVLQLSLFAIAFWVPAMIFVGVLFGALWIASLVIGSRIEREMAERAASSEVERPAGSL